MILPMVKNNIKLSNEGFDFIIKHEGFINKPYADPVGILTIGVGHVIKKSETYLKNAELSDAEVYDLFKYDLLRFELFLNSIITKHNLYLNPNQYAALISFSFNVGVHNFKKSTLLKKVINNSLDSSIKNEFNRWVYAKNIKLQGLIKRRKQEAELYFKEYGEIVFSYS